MKIIEVEDRLAMYLAQYTGYVDEGASKPKESSYMYQLIQLKREIKKKFNVSFQMFNSKFAISENQIKFILHHVYSTFSLKSNISKHYDVEFLLYLSHERQITKAIEKVGVKNPNEKNEISYGEILFGEPEKLEQAIKFLDDKIDICKHSQFKYLEPNEWEFFMKTYQISIDQVSNILRGNNYTLKGKINSLDDLKDSTSSDLIREAITDAYNTGMVKLFLENFKKNKRIVEK